MEETLDREYGGIHRRPRPMDRLKELTPDLLITRTYVQSMSGTEIPMYLRTKSPKMKVLLVGGLLTTIHYREAFSGFEVFRKQELLQKVSDVLNKPRS